MKVVGAWNTLNLNLSGLRILLSMYFLTYGMFGYGSEISFTRPVTALPMISGIVLGAVLFIRSRKMSVDWHMKVRIDVQMVAVFLLTFACLLVAHRERLPEELVDDELSYIQLSHAHSIQLLGFAPEAFGAFEASTLIRATSLLVIVGTGLLVWLGIWKQTMSRAIILTFTSAALLQITFAILGGWGWGYTKVAWLPHLLGTTALGISPVGFRVTSIALVAAAFTLLYQVLRALKSNSVLPLLTVTCLATMPLASIFHPSVDHIIFFLLFAVPSLVFLVYRPSDDKFIWLFTFLTVGVMLRLTVSFVLISLVVSYLFYGGKRAFRAGIVQLLIPLGFLIPYAVGTALSPAVSFDRVESQTLTAAEMGAQDWVTLFGGQIGLPTILFLLAGLIMGAFSQSRILPTVTFIGFVSFFYFFALGSSGLVGEPKYSVEWASSFTLLAILWGALIFERIGFGERLRWFTVTAILVASNIASPFWSEETSSTVIGTRASEEPIGYLAALEFLDGNQVCQPVGVVYGAGNEIMLGKSWSNVKEVRRIHDQLQARIAAEGMEWSRAYAEWLVDEGIGCAYGVRSSFQALDLGEWDEWNVIFSYENSSDLGDLIVMARSQSK